MERQTQPRSKSKLYERLHMRRKLKRLEVSEIPKVLPQDAQLQEKSCGERCMEVPPCLSLYGRALYSRQPPQP